MHQSYGEDLARNIAKRLKKEYADQGVEFPAAFASLEADTLTALETSGVAVETRLRQYARVFNHELKTWVGVYASKLGVTPFHATLVSIGDSLTSAYELSHLERHDQVLALGGCITATIQVCQSIELAELRTNLVSTLHDMQGFLQAEPKNIALACVLLEAMHVDAPPPIVPRD